MRVASVSSAELFAGELRLGPDFYVASDQAALDVVTAFGKADALSSLCLPHGLYRGPIFRRVFAADPAFGRPYVTATDLEQAEVRPVVYLSRIHGDLLDRLALQPDRVVVSCSGVNLGKAFYVRPDMDGLVASHDLIRIDVDPDRVKPGYLFAFLDSRFGRSALRQSIHGGSVRHIEPEDLAEIRVPRLDPRIETNIDAQVFQASRLLSAHVEHLDQATRRLEAAAGLPQILLDNWDDEPAHRGWSNAAAGEESLRALNHDPRVTAVREAIAAGRHDHLGDLCDPAYFRGKQIFKREEAQPGNGVLLLGQRAAFRLRPEGRYISHRSVDANRLRLPAGTTLIPSHGTLGARELYCRAVAVTPGLSGNAYSGDFFRCVPLPDLVLPGYLYAFLRSRYAFRLLRGMSSGGKQQELSRERMAAMPVPRLDPAAEAAIAAQVEQAWLDYDSGVGLLTAAREEFERALAPPGDF